MNILRDLKLTLSQWAAVTAAAAIGVLVFLLKMQGKRLHRAQVQLLEVRLDAKAAAGDAEVATALGVYKKAKEEFEKAGGKI